MVNRKFENEAAEFVRSIVTIASKPGNFDNLEGYLSMHFDKWLELFARTPEGMTAELESFAEMEI